MSKSHTAEKSSTFATSLEKTVKERAALSPSELVLINIDVPSACVCVVGAAPRIHAMRTSIVKHTPLVDINAIDKLESYAEACGEANGIYVALAALQTTDLPGLLKRGMELRTVLVSDATALVTRGAIEGRLLADLHGSIGYLNVSTDLNILVQAFRSAKSVVAGKSGVTAEELVEAHTIYEKITKALGSRDVESEEVAAAADTRHRAFTLMVSAYEQARRAVTFIRWAEDDVDQIAPSLWAGRGRRARADAPVVVPAAPAAPAVTPAAPQVAPVGLGMPGGSPFTNGPVNH